MVLLHLYLVLINHLSTRIGIVNSIGPKTMLCDTPLFIFLQLLMVLLVRTYLLLFLLGELYTNSSKLLYYM